MSILDKLKKNSTIKDSSILSKSKYFQDKDMITTSVPAMNIALSGSITGGLTPGLTMWAGPSKHFKTGFSLLMSKAYMDKYKDAVLLFYDSEFGTPQAYFDTFGIDPDRVIHTPVTDIEQLKFDIMNQLNEVERGDRVIIMIDSIGNIASKKEVEDAMNEKSVADMSRAKQIKSLFRMVTPHLNLKDIPMLAINHTYKEMALFPKDIVSGGTGSMYSSDNVFIVGRQQEKDGKEISGYNFIIKVEKSRFTKEGSKIPINVDFETGINKWSGLMDIALELGFCTKPKNGWYAKVDTETGEVEEPSYRLKNTMNKEFWMPILKDVKFQKAVEKKFKIGFGSIENYDTESEDEFIEEVQEKQDDDTKSDPLDGPSIPPFNGEDYE